VLTILFKIKKLYSAVSTLNKFKSNHKKLHTVITYNKYNRLDRGGNKSPNFKIARELKMIGIDRITLFTPHSNESIKHYEKFFGDKVDIAELASTVGQFIKFKNHQNYLVGAPDGGNKKGDRAILRAELLAQNLFGNNFNDRIFLMTKKRLKHGKISSEIIKGNVEGKNIFLIDDMIDTGNTAIEAAKTLKKSGALDIILIASHGVFSKSVDYVLNHNLFEEIIVTDSTDISDPRITILSSQSLLSSKSPISSQVIKVG
jgi:ribose-phosphate pyrophosphokinase